MKKNLIDETKENLKAYQKNLSKFKENMDEFAKVQLKLGEVREEIGKNLNFVLSRDFKTIAMLSLLTIFYSCSKNEGNHSEEIRPTEKIDNILKEVSNYMDNDLYKQMDSIKFTGDKIRADLAKKYGEEKIKDTIHYYISQYYNEYVDNRVEGKAVKFDYNEGEADLVPNTGNILENLLNDLDKTYNIGYYKKEEIIESIKGEIDGDIKKDTENYMKEIGYSDKKKKTKQKIHDTLGTYKKHHEIIHR